MRSFPSRKAQVELSLQQIIGLVIAIIIILATVAFFMGLMNIFMGPPDSGSLRTWNLAYEVIESLYDKRNLNTSCYISAGFLKEDIGIVGFNADGMAAAGNDGIICEMGENCIEETCGAFNENIEKPNSCGTGPCLCVCDGGMGDLTDDDCKASGAKCQKFPSSIGFDVMYFVDTDDDECTSSYRVPGTGEAGSLCDLMYRGSGCGVVGQGDERGTKYNLYILQGEAKTRTSRTGKAVIFDIVKADQFGIAYPDVKTDCQIMLNNLRKERHVVPTRTAETEEPEDTLNQPLSQGGAKAASGISVSK
ncbi:hypothetical protein ACFL3V_07160 [Nanoarchaeota archaeon]